MNLSQNILNTVTKLTHDFDNNSNAEYLSKQFSISRNRCSSILNTLYKKGILIKIISRPVIFFDKSYLEKLYRTSLVKNEYSSVSKLKKTFFKSPLEEIIGFDGSLENLLFQCKAAVAYSKNGLPIMFVGASGTGKTFIAKKIYKYSLEQNIITKNAPFVHINCSEYANNPELFLSNLFGSVKGAYTGAYKDNIGLLEEANNGYLFLDEIHALDKSCQEKLFQFMDDGKFHQMGDNENWHETNIRLLFATTEYPSDRFLTTFLRRIPIILNVPPLNKRSQTEKMQIIASLLSKEEVKINKKIEISDKSIHYLLDTSFPGNVGEMKNLVKIAVANQSFLSKGEIVHLPISSFIYGKFSELTRPEKEFFSVEEISKLISSHTDNSLIINKISKFISQNMKNESIDNSFLSSMWELFGHIPQNTSTVRSKEQSFLDGELNNIIFEIETEKSFGYFSFSKKNIDFQMLTNLLLTFCNHSNFNLFSDLNIQAQSVFSSTKEVFFKESKLAKSIMTMIEKNFSIRNDSLCQLIILCFINYYSISKTQNDTIGIIMAHGDRVATEIASSANNMLNSYIFDPIDLSLTANVKEAILILKNKLIENKQAKKIAILTDMGSLSNIEIDEFKQNADCIIVNSVNPPLALTIGNDLLENKSLQQIKTDSIEYSSFFSVQLFENQKKNVILCSCAAGKESNTKISSIFKRTFSGISNLKILSVEYEKLLQKKTQDQLKNDYNIIFIIGTLDPELPTLPFVSIGDLIADNKNQLFVYLLSNLLTKEEVETINKKLLAEFTLTNLVNEITILNPDKLLRTVSEAIDLLQQKMGFSIPINVCFSLYIHTCCMIERLIRTKDQDSELSAETTVDKKFQTIFKESFSLVEKYYSVSISNEEINYIKDYIYME